jgi:predicted acyltransferase
MALQRSNALDALRGYAILTMVLSGAVASTLPAWMYHAQTPPPDHVFNPAIYGISWVDLVFPFFLFAMGAAMPFSLGRKIERGMGRLRLSLDSLLRGLQLAFFAIFIQHMYSFSQADPQSYGAWFITLAAFVVLFPMFMRMPWKMPAWGHYAVKAGGYLIAVVMLLTVRYADGKSVNLNYSNIIILLLANMAVFGSLIYIYTKKYRWARIAVLPFVMAILVSSSDVFAGSWQKALFNFSPFPWLYQFTFLKYLFIVIPGTVAGEFLYDWFSTAIEKPSVKKDRGRAIALSVLAFLLIVENLYGLFSRHLVFNILVSVVLIIAGGILLSQQHSAFGILWKRLFLMGAVLLLLGLFFEAFEGGIRKDDATFSYFFVTSGLACMALIFFSVVCDFLGCSRVVSFLTLSGQNPMIAYVGADMVVYPVAKIFGVLPVFFAWCAHGWWGLFQGVVVTALVTMITVYFSKKKWFWRT